MRWRCRNGPIPLFERLWPVTVSLPRSSIHEMPLRQSFPWAGALTGVSLVILLSLPISTAFGSAGYVWPLSERTPITSTFGEYRAGHFHGGLDLSTGGETGKEVFALASGHVWRMRVSGTGYGRALYIAMDDGRTAVYGHLQDFVPRIEAVAESVQRARGRYRIDYILPGEDLSVSAGELIAHSGDTGAGPAHLHVEIREGDRQMNPLLYGLAGSDSRPPRIGSIVLVPIGPHSTVDGRHEPLAVGLRWGRGGLRYTTARVPLLQGDVAVASRLYDLADGRPNRLAPYGAALRLDGETLYDLTFDSVSLGSTREVELVYNYDYAMRGGSNVLNMFCAPGRGVGLSADETPLRGIISIRRTASPGAGVVPVGEHTIEVEAWDAAGNRRTGRMRVVADNRPELTEASLDDTTGVIRVGACDPDGDPVAVVVDGSLDGGVTWSEVRRGESTGCYRGELLAGPLEWPEILRVRAVDGWGATSEPSYLGPGLLPYAEAAPTLEIRMHDGYAEVLCELAGPAAGVPQLWLVDGDATRSIRSLPLERLGLSDFRTVVDLADSLGPRAAVMAVAHLEDGARSVLAPLNVARVRAGGRRRVALPGGATLVTSEETFTDDVFVMTEVGDSTPAEPVAGLVPAGVAYRLDPPTQFFNSTATLYLPAEGAGRASSKLGLYRKAGRGDWRWVGNASADGGRLIGGDILHFSEYALMEDVEPPKVYRLRPGDGAKIRRARPTLEARVKDAGSGLDWDSVYFTIDGERLITGWEAEADYAWARVPHDLEPGPHRVEFFAEDRAGNEARAAAAVFVVR